MSISMEILQSLNKPPGIMKQKFTYLKNPYILHKKLYRGNEVVVLMSSSKAIIDLVSFLGFDHF